MIFVGESDIWYVYVLAYVSLEAKCVQGPSWSEDLSEKTQFFAE